MSWSLMTMAAAIVMTGTSCKLDGLTAPRLGAIDSEAKLAQLMDAAALPLARLFTSFDGGSGVPILEGTATGAAAAVDRSNTAALTSPVSCPSGGSAAYNNVGTTQVTFTNCDLGGVAFTGVLNVWIALVNPTDNMAVIQSGNLTMSGGATGTLAILDGLIQWSIPVADASTYWQLRATVNGAPVCAWSGGGACQQ